MRKTGQSTLEYAIILALIIFVIMTVGRQALRTGLETALQNAGNRIATEAGGLSR